MERVKQLLDYMHTDPNAVVHYHASDMILNVHSDASYLSAGRGRSRAGGHFFLGTFFQQGTPIKLNEILSLHVQSLSLSQHLPQKQHLEHYF